jgi:hypothetical protein
MSSFVSHTSVDCTDAYALSRWWQAVLDYVEDADHPNKPGHEECLISSRDGHHDLLFIEVPDAKRVKNRVHLDLRPREGLTRRRTGPPPRAWRDNARRPPQQGRHRLGRACRPRGQRVLHPA